MKIVGHTTPNMVSRYAHMAPNSLKGTTDCLDRKDGTPVVQKAPSRAVGKGRS